MLSSPDGDGKQKNEALLKCLYLIPVTFVVYDISTGVWIDNYSWKMELKKTEEHEDKVFLA